MINLKQFLFEPIEADTSDKLRLEIVSTISFWLPFVNITELRVDVGQGKGEFDRNSIKIDITFSLSDLPDMLESVQIEI